MVRTAGAKQPTPSFLELMVQVGVESVARRISAAVMRWITWRGRRLEGRTPRGTHRGVMMMG